MFKAWIFILDTDSCNQFTLSFNALRFFITLVLPNNNCINFLISEFFPNINVTNLSLYSICLKKIVINTDILFAIRKIFQFFYAIIIIKMPRPRYRQHTFEIQIIERIQQQRNQIDSSYLSSNFESSLGFSINGSSETLSSLRSLGIDTTSYESIRNLHRPSYLKGIENGYSKNVTKTTKRFW